ncbi:MAG: hypothetical protein ACRCXX_14230 [Cetobacterium sp.]|uniref:hypothetical protein n=1 Tax=Cetobacterium sp. TaxID=2071632 RepID=UPI003F2CE243
MDKNNFGFIENIDETKFMCNGSIYVESNLSESTKVPDLTASILSMKFENKVFEIINKVNDENTDKSLDERNKEVEKFLDEKENSVLDVIFFPDNGFRGRGAIVMEENSIFYIKISENLKLGFFINKIILKAIMGGVNNVG